MICHDEALDGLTSIEKKPSAKERNHETLSHQKSLALGSLALKPQIRTWLVFWSCFGDDYGDVACWTIVDAEDWIHTYELDRRRRQYTSFWGERP